MIWVCIECLKKMLFSSLVILVRNWNVIIILKVLFYKFCICMLDWFFYVYECLFVCEFICLLYKNVIKVIWIF